MTTRGRVGAPACAAGATAPANDATPTNIASVDRTFAKFTFFKIDPAWQRRDSEARAEDKREFLAACEDFAADRPLRAYSTVGTRGDVDLLLLSQSPVLEDLLRFQEIRDQGRGPLLALQGQAVSLGRLFGVADEDEAATAQARVGRIDDAEREADGDCRVNRVAAFLQRGNAGVGGQRMDRGDHALR